jgi:hypothetical protein
MTAYDCAMELYACGFNAYNQLRFEGIEEALPDDLHAWTCVLTYDRIRNIKPTLSYTLGMCTSRKIDRNPGPELSHC